jgi:hypothetical protein
MNRAAKLLGKSEFAAECVSPAQVAVAAWPFAIGPRLAARTRAVALVDGKLLVDVEDRVWQNQLTTLKRHILASVAKALGPGLVTDLHFRVAVPKKTPMRENQVVRPDLFDEADAIKDPILRRIYKASRRRATA